MQLPPPSRKEKKKTRPCCLALFTQFPATSCTLPHFDDSTYTCVRDGKNKKKTGTRKNPEAFIDEATGTADILYITVVDLFTK